jgi:hypothetical protein
MDDLISRSALKEELLKLGFFPVIVENALDRQPTVDAVEVVRCKDCVYYNPRWHTCMGLYLAGQTLVNGYCFNGMKKKV